MISKNKMDVSKISMSTNDVEEITEFIISATNTDFLVEDIDFTSPTITADVLNDTLEIKKGLYIYILFIILDILFT